MGVRSGTYSKNIFDPLRRYSAILMQESRAGSERPVVDADLNDSAENIIENIRRFRYETFGIGTPGADHWEIIQSPVNTTNNFAIDGGDSTAENAARFYLGGHMAVMPGYAGAVNKVEFDPQHSVVTPATDMDYIHHVSTDIADTYVDDVDGHYIVNELVGRMLVPDVTTPANRYAITANTATRITCGGGGIVAGGANIGDYYCVIPTTPAAGRTDEVYLDVYLDEIDAVEDSNLSHTIAGAPGLIESARRLKVIQQIHVLEDIVANGSYTALAGYPTYVAASGNRHYRFRLATIARLAADATITTAMLTDARPFTDGYGSSREVVAARNSTVYATAYNSLDDRLEFVEDDAIDAHRFTDMARIDGTITSGGACSNGGLGSLNYAAWTGFVSGEYYSIGAGALALAAFVGTTRFVYVDTTGVVTHGLAVPASGAMLARVEIDGGGLISDIQDWRFFISNVDTHMDIVVEETAAGVRGNMANLQAAIVYAIQRGYTTIRVKGDNTAYITTATILINSVGSSAPVLPSNLRIVFENGAYIQPNAPGFNAINVVNTNNISIEGLRIDGTNMGAADVGLYIQSSNNVKISNYICDNAGNALSINTVSRLLLNDFYFTHCQNYGINHTAGVCDGLSFTNGYIDGAPLSGIYVGVPAALDGVVVRNVKFGTTFSISAYFGASATNCLIDECRFDAINGNALFYTAGNKVKVSHCSFTASTCAIAGAYFTTHSHHIIEDCTFGVITGSSAIHFNTVQNSTIRGCVVDQTGSPNHAFYIDTSHKTKIVESVILGGGSTGIYAINADYCSFANNYITLTTAYGIQCTTCDHLNISANTVNEIDDTGVPSSIYIYLIGCVNTAVTGNSLASTGAFVSIGIQTDATGGGVYCNNCSISSNTMILGGISDQGLIVGGAAAADNSISIVGNIIESSSAAPINSVGIYISNVSGLTIVANTIKYYFAGISNNGSANHCVNLVISDNNIVGSPAFMSSGIWLNNNFNSVTISNNSISSPGNGIQLAPAAVLTHDCAVVGNSVRNAAFSGIVLSSGSSFSIGCNSIYHSALHGIYIGATVSLSSISGNSIISSGAFGIVLDGSSDCVVGNNMVRHSTSYGIYINGGDRNVVSGNSCYVNTLHGIYLAATSNSNSIVGNVCNANVQAGIYVAGSTRNVVGNNVCLSNATHGIYFDNTWGSLTGNVSSANTDNGITIPVTATDNSVSSNTAETNGLIQINNLGANNGFGVQGAAVNVTTNVCAVSNKAVAGGIVG